LHFPVVQVNESNMNPSNINPSYNLAAQNSSMARQQINSQMTHQMNLQQTMNPQQQMQNPQINRQSSLPSGAPVGDLMSQLEDYHPTIPDSVTAYYVNRAGFEASDPRVIRLISLAAQKFVSDVANDALTFSRMRGAGHSKKKSSEKRYTLTMEDLAPALNEYGVNVKKPHYFT